MIEPTYPSKEDLRLMGTARGDFPEGSILEAALQDTKKRIADAFEGQAKIQVTVSGRVKSDTSLARELRAEHGVTSQRSIDR
jgi:hypothetical protein